MDVNDVRLKFLDQLLTDICSRPAEGGEALGVVRPVLAVGSGIGVAGTVEQMRCIEREHVEALGRAGQKRGRAAEQIGP